MRNFVSLLAMGLSLVAAAPTKPTPPLQATEIFRFPNGTTRLENLRVLPNGHLLLTSLSSTDLLTLDPTTNPPQASTLLTLPADTPADQLLGITPLSPNRYAISGGTPHPTLFARFLPGTFRIYIVSLSPHSLLLSPSGTKTNWNATLEKTIRVPDTEFINGLTTLPGKNSQHIILGADSFGGRVLRTDTITGNTTVVLSDPLLGHDNATDIPIGINGLHVNKHDGHLYFTNSRLGTFSRVRINVDDGSVLKGSKIEKLAELPGHDGTHLFDDFDFDFGFGGKGNGDFDVYSTAHPGSLVRISLGAGKKGGAEGAAPVTTVVGGDDKAVLDAPTAAAFGSLAGEKVLWVTSMAGQVVKVTGF